MARITFEPEAFQRSFEQGQASALAERRERSRDLRAQQAELLKQKRARQRVDKLIRQTSQLPQVGGQPGLSDPRLRNLIQQLPPEEGEKLVSKFLAERVSPQQQKEFNVLSANKAIEILSDRTKLRQLEDKPKVRRALELTLERLLTTLNASQGPKVTTTKAIKEFSDKRKKGETTKQLDFSTREEADKAKADGTIVKGDIVTIGGRRFEVS